MSFVQFREEGMQDPMFFFLERMYLV